MPLNSNDRIAIWHRAIETQIHFAELSIKMRQIGITLAGGTIALAVALYRIGSGFSFAILGFNIPISSIFCMSAALILYAAWMIDVGVYHRMLRGAVKFNELYERDLDETIHWKAGLTETISAYSRYENPTLLCRRDEDGTVWVNSDSTEPASNRITTFYILSILALIISGIGIALVDNFGKISVNAGA